MKTLLLFLLPFTLFAQEKNDSINLELKNKLVSSIYQVNRIDIKEKSFENFNNEMKSFGITIRNNQLIGEYSYQWNYEQSLGYNIVGNIMNNILNAKKLNP